MKSNDYSAVILEEIRDQNKAVLEAVGQMQDFVANIPAMQSDLLELKADVKTIKAVVTETNKDLVDLDRRVTLLKQAS